MLSTPEENKAIARRIYEEGFNGRNVGVIDEMYSPEFVGHVSSTNMAQAPDLEEDKRALGAMLAAFPDGRITIEELVAEGDRVAIRFTFRGTHEGALFGIPPTGRPVTFSAIDIGRYVGGKLAGQSHLQRSKRALDPGNPHGRAPERAIAAPFGPQRAEKCADRARQTVRPLARPFEDAIALGKLAENWSQADRLGMMQQLGVVNVPGQAGG
jgi:predicted ester cyclase